MKKIYRVSIKGNAGASSGDDYWYFVAEGPHEAAYAAQVILEEGQLPVYIRQVEQVAISQVPGAIREAVLADLDSEGHKPTVRTVEQAEQVAEQVSPIRITFAFDEKNDRVVVLHDGEIAWQEHSFDFIDQYLRHVAPTGRPVIIEWWDDVSRPAG